MNEKRSKYQVGRCRPGGPSIESAHGFKHSPDSLCTKLCSAASRISIQCFTYEPYTSCAEAENDQASGEVPCQRPHSLSEDHFGISNRRVTGGGFNSIQGQKLSFQMEHILPKAATHGQSQLSVNCPTSSTSTTQLKARKRLLSASRAKLQTSGEQCTHLPMGVKRCSFRTLAIKLARV